MKAHELHTAGSSELLSLLKEEEAKLLNLRMRRLTSPLKNVKEIREVRKNIARIKTVIHNK